MTMLTERFHLDPNCRLLLVVGFLGGYTTFSSFEWETYTAVRAGGIGTGMLNAVSSVMLGYVAVWLGSMLATASGRERSSYAPEGDGKEGHHFH
jgi:CrcB protein